MINKQQAEVLAEKWRARFVDEEDFKASWARYFASATAPSPERLDQWLAEDAESAAAAAVVSTKEALLPVQQHAPELSAEAWAKYIAAGDVHDDRDPYLSPLQHEAICPRCQLGRRSRELVDERAARTNKAPFPGFGSFLSVANRRQWCDDCGLSEDELPGDFCDRSFWHLPEIWVALHPDEPTMPDMGPFMRAFLRAQRPAQEIAA